MKPPAPKISALVVSAIRNLRESRGSTAKDIMNYIVSEHHSGDTVIQRQMNAALKRGVDYGILKRVNGHYSLNGDTFCINPQNMVPEDRARRRKRKGRRGGRRRGGRRGRRGKGRRRAMKVQRRGMLNRKRGMHVRRVNENYGEDTASTERTRTEHAPAEHRTVDVPRRGSSKEKEHSRSRSRSRPSRSQQRISSRQPSRQGSPTQSRSSTNSDREDLDNQGD